MGGKCKQGAEVLLRRAIDKATQQPLGANATGKFGTPKCEFICQLLRCVEPENGDEANGVRGCWVGAHPSLGEKAASALLSEGMLEGELGKVATVKREVSGVAGTDMRCDFVLTSADGHMTVVEVKTVVDTDYDPSLTTAERFPNKKAVFLGKEPYERAAIFPWCACATHDTQLCQHVPTRHHACKSCTRPPTVCRMCGRVLGRWRRARRGNSNQKGPDGEKVVSARAIKHVRELTALASGEKTIDGARLSACVLFIVVRSDARSFRPNAEACPSFARYLREAHAAGVKVIARRVRWGDGAADEPLGAALDDGPLPVVL
jgi:DNA-binding sugar fermentation-stimulating protein